MARGARVLCGIAIGAALVTATADAAAQELGHKVLGGLGVDAGTQPKPGIYAGDRFLYYAAGRIVDRNGDVVPIRAPHVDVAADAVGVGATMKWARLPYVTVAAAVPVARIGLEVAEPRRSVDRFGLGDVFVEPLKLGWGIDRFDVVTSYAFYVPTGAFQPGGGSGGVGRGHWTHQFSVGGAVFADAARRWRASALATYDLNTKKRGIDITRGDTVRIEGGAGARVFGVLDLGGAAYALWQVGEDRGADLPASLRGARERAYGLGPEMGVVIPMLRARITFRAMWDFAAESRPEGRVLMAQIGELAMPSLP